MYAPHRPATSSAASTVAAPPLSRSSGRLIVLGLLCALLAGCGPQAPAPAASDDGAPERFVFVRAMFGMVRIDTSTGQVWTVPLNGDGGWAPRGAAPDLAGESARNGRFNVRHLPPARNTTRLGPNAAEPPVLLRVDRATGRSWLLESEDAQSWMAVGETGQSPTAEPAAPSSPPPAASTSSSSTGSKALDPSSPKAYPILTGDQLGVTPEEKQRTVQTLRTARSKQELPQKMRVWAVRQLGEVDPDLAVPELLDVLNDPDPVLVAEAVQQLGRIGHASTLPLILKLRDHPDAGVRAAVAEVVVEVQ